MRYRGFIPLMGDPLPYGMKANRASIDALMTYALQQKLIPERMPLEQAFFDPEAVVTIKDVPCRSSTSIPHVIATDNVRYPLQPLGGNQSTWSRDRPTPYDKMIEAMDQAGVAKSAIVQASTAYGHDNSYVAEAIAAHPKRFTGVFSIDMLAPDNVEKMKHWLARGFSGMRLFTTGSTMPGQATWFDDPRTFPAWQHATDTGMPVCMQMTPQGFPQLRGLIERFPKVKFILDHLARPHLVDGPPFAARPGIPRRCRAIRMSFSSSRRSTSSPDWGKATPETFFGGADRRPMAPTASPGARTSRRPRAR